MIPLGFLADHLAIVFLPLKKSFYKESDINDSILHKALLSSLNLYFLTFLVSCHTQNTTQNMFFFGIRQIIFLFKIILFFHVYKGRLVQWYNLISVLYPSTDFVILSLLSHAVCLSCAFRSLFPGKGSLTWGLALVTHQWEDGEGGASHGTHRNQPLQLARKIQRSRFSSCWCLWTAG